MTFDRMIALDFETTGLNPGYRPLEIAWVEFDSNFNVVEQVTSLINPHIPIESGAQRTHGISAEMLVNEPSLDDFLKKTHAGKFADEHVLVVAHNASYDVPMFHPYCKKITPLCTMRLGQTLYPDAKNHTLQTLSTLLNVDVEPTHRALDDALTSFYLMKNIATEHGMSIDEMLTLIQSASLDSPMPFGKHKGTKLKDLPSDYVRWLTENLDPGGWIVEALLGR
jgi:exodeoxyribonuclease X